MPSKSIQCLYRDGFDYLTCANFLDIEVTILFVIQHVFNEEYLSLVAKDAVATLDQQQHVFSLLDACLSGQPLAYVLGSAEFNGRRYVVQPGVLIPRPETEELVQLSVHMIQWLFSQAISPVVFECGLGSGVISLELAQLFSQLSFFGWDVSSVATDTTRINMTQFGVDNLSIQQGDFFSLALDQYMPSKMHVLISNPPYVSESEYALMEEHLKREPKIALVALNNGVSIISQLIEFSVAHSMILICEIGFKQRGMLLEKYPHLSLFFTKDLSGHDRFLFYFPMEMLPSDELKNKLNIM